jgi:hypothetical protein
MSSLSYNFHFKHHSYICSLSPLPSTKPVARRDDVIINGNKYKLPIVLMYGNIIQKNEPPLAVKVSSTVS